MFEVQSASWPNSPLGGAAVLKGRIQVSGVVGVGDEVGGEETNGEKMLSGMPRSDMTSSDGNDFEGAIRAIQHKSSILSP